MYLKSLNIRLTALFSLLFIVLSLLLFVFTYVLLHSTLSQEQDVEIKSRMLEFWVLYQINGLDLLNEEVFTEQFLAEWRFYLIRIAGEQNETLFLYVPEHWTGLDPGKLEEIQPDRGGEPIRLYSEDKGLSIEVASLSLPDGNTLQIGVNIQNRIRTLNRFRRIFVIVAIPLLFFGFLGGLIFSNRSLRPIHKLIGVIRSIIETGKMDERIPVRGTGDELDELVLFFNRMLEKIDALVRGMRETLDNVAHDLRTPMTRFGGKAQLALQSQGGEEAYREALTECIRRDTDHARNSYGYLRGRQRADEARFARNRPHPRYRGYYGIVSLRGRGKGRCPRHRLSREIDGIRGSEPDQAGTGKPSGQRHKIH